MNKTQVTALLKTKQDARNKRLALEEEVKKLKVVEDTTDDLLEKANVQSDAYGPYILTRKEKPTPRCTDWAGLHAHIKETGEFDLLHKRLTETAVMARLGDGVYLPGIVVDKKVTYTITAK
jgi:hypothetical protein